MCGRFSLIEDISLLKSTFKFEFNDQLAPRYNITLGQPILSAVMDNGNRVGKIMKWGLVPFWSNDPKIGYRMINARSEGIESKPSFKNAFKRKRALILSSGYYEWKNTKDGKQPFRFVMNDHKPFAFAGIYETWNKGEAPLVTCSIITTAPNKITQPVHDRMPVCLPPEVYDDWLDPKNDDTGYLKSLLVPFPSEKMKKYPVSTLVNSPKNDLAEILSPWNSL